MTRRALQMAASLLERFDRFRCMEESAVRAAAQGLSPRAAALAAVGRSVPKRELPLCGALTRVGRPCRARAYRVRAELVPRNGRCRMHGGLSTGPRTAAGLAAVCRSLPLANAARARKARR
jgi:hypothetical protein